MRSFALFLIALLPACSSDGTPGGDDPTGTGGSAGSGSGSGGTGGGDGGDGGEGNASSGTCGENETSVNGTCVCKPGYFGDDCAACDCPDDTECADGKSGDGSCSGEREVACSDEAPAHATSESEMVTISYDSDSGWPDPPACEWTCDDDYAEVDGACIDSMEVPCEDTAPAHASAEVEDVTVTYTSAGGWSDPAECDWSCDTDWYEDNGACIDSRMEPCTDAAPAGAESVVANVTVTYTTAGGWSTPADCDWNCLSGYREVGSSCVNAPIVVDSTPGAGELLPGGALVLEFSEPMNKTSVEGAIEVSPSRDLDFAWSLDATSVTITAEDGWMNQVEYDLVVHTTATDDDGNALESEFDIEFFGTAWVRFYASDDTTSGDLPARAGGLGLANGSARIAADALCGAAAFATKPAACTQGHAAVISISSSDQAVDLPTNYDLFPESSVLTPGGAVLESQWSGLFDGSISSDFVTAGIAPNAAKYIWWSGSNVDGTFDDPGCLNFTNGTTGTFGQDGSTADADSTWIVRSGGIACQNVERLLCMCW